MILHNPRKEYMADVIPVSFMYVIAVFNVFWLGSKFHSPFLFLFPHSQIMYGTYSKMWTDC